MERLEKLCISGELAYPNVRAKSSAVARGNQSSRASGRRYTLAPRCLTGGVCRVGTQMHAPALGGCVRAGTTEVNVQLERQEQVQEKAEESTQEKT